MITLTSAQIVQETALRWKKEGHAMALVPTMGALHRGHIALVQEARVRATRVIVSIFVNPLQFGAGEDLKQYPRPIKEDSEALEKAGVDLLFRPSPEEMYPPKFSTSVRVGALSQHLCGAHRPGHFDGVATVCLKLFQITQPDFAVFGEKDFQQLQILTRLVEDLNLPMAVVPFPTVRETDGLALSSRNAYLSREEREIAPMLSKALHDARQQASDGSLRAGEILGPVTETLVRAGLRTQYVSLCSETDLMPVADNIPLDQVPKPRLFIAAYLGKTRLIDNLSLSQV